MHVREEGDTFMPVSSMTVTLSFTVLCEVSLLRRERDREREKERQTKKE